MRRRLSLLALALGLGGCAEWLDAPDPDAEAAATEPSSPLLAEDVPARLPTAAADPGGAGPLVPATPGLRVPNAGYWTRARLDTADMLLPYTWISLLPGEQVVVLRIEAARRGTNALGAGLPVLRAVVPIELPEGTDVSALGGLTLAGDALAGSTVSIQTTTSDTWHISLGRLTLEEVHPHVVKGSFEGVARRGAQGQRARAFEAGFVALRAPDPSAHRAARPPPRGRIAPPTARPSP